MAPTIARREAKGDEEAEGESERDDSELSFALAFSPSSCSFQRGAKSTRGRTSVALGPIWDSSVERFTRRQESITCTTINYCLITGQPLQLALILHVILLRASTTLYK